MEIRKSDIGDLPMMAKHGRYFHEIAPYGKFMGYDEVRIQNNLLGIISGKYSTILTAWEGDVFMGMLAAIIINNLYDPLEYMAECLFVAVLPEFQKKKVSTALMEEFEKWAVSNGSSIIVYAGYSDKFISAMKRKGYEQVEVMMMKRVEGTDGISL